MAILFGYVTINGGAAKNYPYNAEVKTQKEIESHRQKLIKKHNKKNNKHKYIISFALKKSLNSDLRC